MHSRKKVCRSSGSLLALMPASTADLMMATSVSFVVAFVVSEDSDEGFSSSPSDEFPPLPLPNFPSSARGCLSSSHSPDLPPIIPTGKDFCRAAKGEDLTVGREWADW